MTTVLAEVGARLSDVFGAERILWVEGQTEELCFPIILRGLNRALDGGTVILAVRQTGDFKSSDKKRVLEVYHRLCRGAALIPPAVGFLFDREREPESVLQDLRRRDGRVHFTRRRMFENYLLVPKAIARVLVAAGCCVDAPTPAAITTWWREADETSTYRRADWGLVGERSWLNEVDGARLLGATFWHFSANTCRYDKVEDGRRLVEAMLELHPESFAELADSIEAAGVSQSILRQ